MIASHSIAVWSGGTGTLAQTMLQAADQMFVQTSTVFVTLRLA